jgi:hypothetical protein
MERRFRERKGIDMPESVTQPDSDQERDVPEQIEQDEKQRADLAKAQEPGENGEAPGVAAPKIIWTPRFLLIFASGLVLGVSADSLLASGWSSNFFAGMGLWFILAHIILFALGWLLLGIVTRSRWVRIGCIFGGVCAAFLTLNTFTQLFGVDPGSPAQSYINVATCTALLGAYVGISIEGTLLSAWDFWLFVLLAILGCAGVVLAYLLTPQASILTVENAVAAATLIAACLIWWARPSCWKKCPGPTFLFGIVPFIQLAMAPVNGSLHNFFFLQVLAPNNGGYANLNNFFFAQFILLCLLLGCIRVAKSEIRN